jgi:hypothetical protein
MATQAAEQRSRATDLEIPHANLRELAMRVCHEIRRSL